MTTALTSTGFRMQVILTDLEPPPLISKRFTGELLDPNDFELVWFCHPTHGQLGITHRDTIQRK